MTAIGNSLGKLNVVGKFAKFDAKFNIDDVTTVIDYLFTGTPTGNVQVNIDDVTTLIDLIFN